MQFKTKQLFAAMLTVMASTYGVADVTEQFAVEPTHAQKLQDKIVESSEFLQKINVIGVTEIKGEKVIGSVAGFNGKRTNTEEKDRQTKSVLQLGSQFYELHSTEFDTHLKYATVDAWAKFPDFEERYAGWVRKAIALARIRVGWHGIEAAAETDEAANPNGEDVNKGWLQLMREFDGGSQWFVEGATLGEIRIGPGGDFENLDAAVHATFQMVDEVHREQGGFVAMIGSDLLAMDKAQLYAAQGQKPTEKERIENQAITRTYRGLPAVSPTYFPRRGIFITRFDNLSIYFQDDSWRRKIEDNAKRNRVEDYNSVNEGYVVEDETAAAGIEYANVKIKDGDDWV